MKVMSVATAYAKIDAWDVADSVYADLLGSGLKISRPERIEFARGLCQLGRAMPDHAREVLAVLTRGGLRGSNKDIGNAVLAIVSGQASSGPAAPVGELAANARPEPTAPVDVSANQAEAERDVQLLAMIRRKQSKKIVRKNRHGEIKIDFYHHPLKTTPG